MIFSPSPSFQNDNFSPNTVEISSFPPVFHIFPLVFAFFLNKSSYFFPQPTKMKIYTHDTKSKM